ncbi:MAG TPA: adenylate/guanylate cyclase domain-containing protein [Marmoricola sp.]|nr:adenylate/guanylate cyclase domain-containing protein [Marmoricola sp.]
MTTSCPKCRTEQPDGARFCFACGAALGAPTCPACGTELVPGARFCGGCGAAQDSAPTAPSGGAPVASRRVTSVLFGDLVGFTTLAEHRDQEETRELLGRYFEECRRVITRYGGTVEKFIGDAVMAVWGVPVAHEDDAERAVRAGLELVAVVTAMGEDLRIAELSMRVGIVTGEVAVTIGAEQQGMVAGDAVNTASRVQSVAAPGQVWVDETTRLLTSSAITYLDMGSHRLKGKADPVPLWSVRAVVAGVGGTQREDGLEAPLVGREHELRLVKEVFHTTDEARRPTLLVMVGEPGVGKTRLAWEFEKYVDGLSMPVRWHNGRCVAYGEGIAYFALAEAIRGRLRVLGPEDADDDLDVVQGLETALQRYAPEERERDWLRPRLGALLGVGSLGTFPREDLFSAWTVFLERVGNGADPVVLVIDDVHHADDGLLQFVEHLLDVGTFPCFVLLLTRPGLLERHPGLATNRHATVSHVHALPDTDMATLLDGLVVGLPDEVRDALVARSEGVPLFAVETVRSLVDRDLVVPRGGRYVLADPSSVDLDSIGAPASLQALVGARLDALAPEHRRLVDRASVIGTVFSRDEVAELCPDIDDVDAALAALVRQQILSQQSSRWNAEYGQYQFVQSVVRQVAYGTLSRRDRRALHVAVARQTAAVEDEAGELAPIIAQHYLDAIEAMPSEGDVDELAALAIAQLERAAARARALGAIAESAGHLQAALERAADPHTRARLEAALAWALEDAGQHEPAIPHAVAAVEAFDTLGDPVRAGSAAAAHGSALMSSGDNAGAAQVVEPRWDSLLEVPGADRALLELGRILHSASSRFGVDRRDVLERRIQIAERAGETEQLAEALTALSTNYSVMGASITARAVMATAADLARTHHYPVALARCLSNLTVEYELDDLALALDTGREGVEVAARAGVAMWRDYTEANLLLALTAAGEWDEVSRMLERGPAGMASQVVTAGVDGWISVVRGHPFAVPWGGSPPESDDPSDTAWIAFAEGQQARAESRGEDSLGRLKVAVDTMVQLSGLSDDFVHMWPVAVDAAIAAGAREHLDHLLDVFDTSSARHKVPLSLRAHRTRFAALLRRDEDPEAASADLADALAAFTEWGSRPYVARTQVELGALLRSTGSVEGEALLESGLATLHELGAGSWITELIGDHAVASGTTGPA